MPLLNSSKELVAGCQPVPSRAVRLRAAWDWPPIHNGGLDWRGLGDRLTSRHEKYFPAKLRWSVRQDSESSSIASSLHAALDSNGTPKDSISSRNHPTPNPTMRRPFERTSRVADALARKRGWRWGNTSTDVPNRILAVRAATNERAESGSRNGVSGEISYFCPRKKVGRACNPWNGYVITHPYTGESGLLHIFRYTRQVIWCGRLA